MTPVVHTKISSSSGRASFHTVIFSGEAAHVSVSTIKAGTGKDGSSQCIVVQGKDIRITDNTVMPNTASKYKGDSSEEVIFGSIGGVRMAQNAECTKTITGNTFICTHTETYLHEQRCLH